jgi:hypothetical protein
MLTITRSDDRSKRVSSLILGIPDWPKCKRILDTLHAARIRYCAFGQKQGTLGIDCEADIEECKKALSEALSHG